MTGPRHGSDAWWSSEHAMTASSFPAASRSWFASLLGGRSVRTAFGVWRASRPRLGGAAFVRLGGHWGNTFGAYYTLLTIYYILHSIYYIVYSIYYVLYTISYVLYTIPYIVYAIYYILHIIYYGCAGGSEAQRTRWAGSWSRATDGERE